MRRNHIDNRAEKFRAGIRALSRHDAQAALRLFRIVVDSCPASEHKALARYLYWLSISLLRLGRSELAVKSLGSAQRLAPRGTARKLYGNMINDYGMVRTGCEEKDDFRAFFAIQIRRYIGMRPGGKFSGEAERDAVVCIITDAWLGLKKTEQLSKKTCSDKLDLFRSYTIHFPFQFMTTGRVLEANFRRGSIQKEDDRCSCGSGLPYRQCCGRTRSAFEVEHGSF